jgi:hypothetical protein
MGDCCSKEKVINLSNYVKQMSPKQLKKSPLLKKSPKIMNHKCQNCNNLFIQTSKSNPTFKNYCSGDCYWSSHFNEKN